MHRSAGEATPDDRVDEIRQTVIQVAADLEANDGPVSEQLSHAAAFSASAAESLLIMREALVMTRSAWDRAEVPSAGRARQAVSDAKRLAIEL